ncbi:MAG: toll/interleukin-1 receptor domain-containing protein [Clostridium sp.]|nr:toll/interleukin-1 receptor domain-containing protein [Clostridium sp.]MCM1474642.1 toll/interleukin-1 receptor domain-containing protein [Muribaculaceae bacterium]
MDTDTNQYEYFAFISYKREDEKWAKWLQRKLEYYKLPSSVRKTDSDLPIRIRPIFRDSTDLEPGILADKIQNALASSRFLIVICSPRSANSFWVSKEVQSFVDIGRADHVIPFIVGGTPNATDPKDECFPVGLRQLSEERELLGANVNEVGRDAAIVKVIARMFDIRFDTLWIPAKWIKRARGYVLNLYTERNGYEEIFNQSFGRKNHLRGQKLTDPCNMVKGEFISCLQLLSRFSSGSTKRQPFLTQSASIKKLVADLRLLKMKNQFII